MCVCSLLSPRAWCSLDGQSTFGHLSKSRTGGDHCLRAAKAQSPAYFLVCGRSGEVRGPAVSHTADTGMEWGPPSGPVLFRALISPRPCVDRATLPSLQTQELRERCRGPPPDERGLRGQPSGSFRLTL